MEINTNTIKSDGKTTVFSNSLEVTFNDPEDRDFFIQTVSDLGIEDSAKQQLYLLEALSFAGVSYVIE